MLRWISDHHYNQWHTKQGCVRVPELVQCIQKHLVTWQTDQQMKRKLHFSLQELEKFKFVLDYKIKELKKQIEPKEEQIADMKDQVKVLHCPALS